MLKTTRYPLMYKGTQLDWGNLSESKVVLSFVLTTNKGYRDQVVIEGNDTEEMIAEMKAIIDGPRTRSVV